MVVKYVKKMGYVLKLYNVNTVSMSVENNLINIHNLLNISTNVEL